MNGPAGGSARAEARNPTLEGFTVLEMLFALTLTVFALSQLGVLVTRTVRLLSRTVHRTDVVHTLGLTRHVLTAELAAGLEVDHVDLGPGRIGTRVFRATATVCPAADSTALVVWTRGDRSPDPSKDSVLVLTEEGRWAPVALVARSSSATSCVDGVADVERWTLSEGVASPVLARVFETGVYSVDRDALRYQRGRGGAQPLTPPKLEPGAARTRHLPSGLEVELTTVPAAGDSTGRNRRFLFKPILEP